LFQKLPYAWLPNACNNGYPYKIQLSKLIQVFAPLEMNSIHPIPFSLPLLKESKDQPQTLEKQTTAHDEEEHVC
jgi:hypothetical protein